MLNKSTISSLAMVFVCLYWYWHFITYPNQEEPLYSVSRGCLIFHPYFLTHTDLSVSFSTFMLLQCDYSSGIEARSSWQCCPAVTGVFLDDDLGVLQLLCQEQGILT